MAASCKGQCHTFKNARKFKYKYSDGYKRCTECEMAFIYEGIWCPCCGTRVRGRSYTGIGRELKRI